MPPLLARSIALFLAFLAVVLGRHVLRAGAGDDQPEIIGDSATTGALQIAAAAPPAKSHRAVDERSRPSGTVRGFDPEVRYTDVPDLEVALRKLPPGTQAHVRCYPGPPSPDPKEPRIIDGSMVVNNSATPQSRAVMLRNIDAVLTKEGPHAIEIVHETGQDAAILYQGMIRVDRTLEMPGTLSARE